MSLANIAYLWVVLYPMMISVELGELTCRNLKGYFGPDLSVGTRKALLHYVYKLRVGRKPVEVPHFLTAPPSPQVKLDLTLDREAEAALAQEARRQGTSTSRLAAHAVLVYLAELEFLGLAPRRPPATTDGE